MHWPEFKFPPINLWSAPVMRSKPMKNKMELTVTCQGESIRDIELALEEATSRILAGNIEGYDVNETGNFSFLLRDTKKILGSPLPDVEDYLNGLYTDFLMLQDNEWEPDKHSIQASIDAVEAIAKMLGHTCLDTRD